MKINLTLNVTTEIESATVAQATLTAIKDGINVNIPEGVLINVDAATAEITQIVDLNAVEEEVQNY